MIINWLLIKWYPEADSNCHAFASASPSSWCVYQFRHLDRFCVANIDLLRIVYRDILKNYISICNPS